MKICSFIYFIISLSYLASSKTHLLALKDSPQVNYTTFIELDYGQDSMAFTPDYTLCIFYNPYNSHTLLYTPYNWQPFPDPDSFYKFTSPTYIKFYRNNNPQAKGKKAYNILYATQKGNIRVKSFFPEYEESIIYSITLKDEQSVSKIVVSSDGSLWAAFLSQEYMVYVGNITGQAESVMKIGYEQNSIIEDIEWRPNSHELIITGKNADQNIYYLKNYNYTNNKNYEFYKPNITVWSVAFSPDQNLMILQSTGQQYSEYVKIYTFEDETLKTKRVGHTAYWISSRGNFISCKSIQNEHIYKFQVNQTFSEELFASQNWMFKSGLSPQGVFLILRPQYTYKYTIYKLCNQIGYYYDIEQQLCNTCIEPCLECLLRAGSCTSCRSSRFYHVPDEFTCLPCPSNCMLCVDNVNCTICDSPYLNDNGICRLCHDIISGCMLCQGVDKCLLCLDSFALDDGHCWPCQTQLTGCQTCEKLDKCLTCKVEFYLEDSKCQLCEHAIPGCQICKNSSKCDLCLESYFLNVNNTCSQCSSFFQGCEKCQKASKCDKCVKTYVLSQKGSCRLCSQIFDDCLTCNNQSACSQCIHGYFVNQSGKCSRCSQIMEGCMKCESIATCKQCSNGYTLNQQQTCSRCASIIEGCLNCQSTSQCTQCQLDFTIVGSKCKQCMELIKGCQRCSSKDVCINCVEDYQLDSTTKKCTQKKGIDLMIYIYVGLGALLLIIILVICFIRQKHRNKTQKWRSRISSNDPLLSSETTTPATSSFLRLQEKSLKEGYLIPE